MKNQSKITPISPYNDFIPLAALLNTAFMTVADDFGLTKENCASNAAYITAEELKRNLNEKREFYRLDVDGELAGFIAIERSGKEAGTYYIEKVAVHPRYRHYGLGAQLMVFAETRIRELGGERISIGLIDEHTRLKNWYQTLGYIQTGIKNFEHLPFTVCFMEKKIQQKSLR